MEAGFQHFDQGRAPFGKPTLIKKTQGAKLPVQWEKTHTGGVLRVGM